MDEASIELPRPLKRGERLDMVIQLANSTVAATDTRLIIKSATGRVVDTRFSALRRIEFDLERSRPATLIIVPERASSPPQVLVVEPEHYLDVAGLIVLIGHRLRPRTRVSPPRSAPD